MAAQPGHMQATNDVISVGICSVVAALLFAQQPERERTVKEQEMSGGGVGREGEWWLTEADQDMVAKSNSRAGQNFCFYLFTCKKRKKEKTRQTISNVTEARNTLQKIREL